MARSRRPRGHRRVREPDPQWSAPASTAGVAGVLFDSDIVIDVLRGRAHVVEAVRALEDDGVPTYCTAVTVAEIHAGLRGGEEHAVQAFFAARGEVVLDAEIGRRAGSFMARYARSHGVELADALIAAAAATSGLSLWTRNRRHYPMSDVAFFEG